MEEHHEQQQQIPHGVSLFPLDTDYFWWIERIAYDAHILVPRDYVELEHALHKHNDLKPNNQCFSLGLSRWDARVLYLSVGDDGDPEGLRWPGHGQTAPEEHHQGQG